MKLTCYGTAAAEAIPGLYCSCGVCQEARRLGGKEIRARHMSAIDKDIQLDIGPDLFYHIYVHGFEPRRVNYLLITHAHGDHFSGDLLNMRTRPFALKLDQPMQVIGSRETIGFLRGALGGDVSAYGIKPVGISPYQTIALDEQTQVTALPANHAPGMGAMIYLISRGGRRLLYAHDTGPFFPEVTGFLQGRGLDAVSLDCTGVYNGAGDHHMTLAQCEAMVSALMENGGLKKDAKVLVNHFSHGGGGLHRQLEQEARKRGWLAAFDGMETEI